MALDVFVQSPFSLDAFVPCRVGLGCIRSEPYSVDAFAPSRGSGEETCKYARGVIQIENVVLVD